MDVKFPKEREELLRLCGEDQSDLRNNLQAISEIKSVKKQESELAVVSKRCHQRAHQMLKILNHIKSPTQGNIGLDGSEAILTITQHSYLPIMKEVLARYEDSYRIAPESVSFQFMPALIDRVRILERQRPIFGTQWTIDKKGQPFLIAVEDFQKVTELRKQYNLGPIRRPVNLAIGAVKYPLGKGLAQASDQKDLTEEEYQVYSRNHLKSLV